MTKQEFLDTLQRALARELSETEVADHINYYNNYIEQQVAAGKSEQQVLAELGDPRLIAKTIRQVDQRREEEADTGSFYEESYGQETQNTPYGEVHRKTLTVKDKAKIAMVILIVLIVLGTVFHILWKMLPFLLAAAGILWLYRKFTER